jgi:pyruvate kinase
MKTFILTVGPSLLNTVPLTEIHRDSHIYRINGAHGTPEDVESTIVKIRDQVSDARILIDLPGNKVRIVGDYDLVAGQAVNIPSKNFNYTDFYEHIQPGMSVFANDSIFELEVVSANAQSVKMLSKSTGRLTNGKGMHIRGVSDKLPFLFEKDKCLIDVANRNCVSYVGLSFVRNANDVREARNLISDSCEIIAKIETAAAVENINDVLQTADYFLIDRGDLSGDIGLENIPRYQDYIIDKVNFFGKRVFVATQLLKNMETRPIPTIAEIEAYYALLKKGVLGFQLSEETAVGKHIREAVDLLHGLADVVCEERLYCVT